MKKILCALVACATLLSATSRPAFAGSDDAMAERAVSLLESAASMVDRDRGNCDRMGDDLSSFIDAKSGEIEELKAWGMHLSRAERHALATKYKARFQAAEGRLRGGITPCAHNAKVRGALLKVGLGG